jgi:hypothetical protein
MKALAYHGSDQRGRDTLDNPTDATSTGAARPAASSA